jgi:hypothetical protein
VKASKAFFTLATEDRTVSVAQAAGIAEGGTVEVLVSPETRY